MHALSIPAPAGTIDARVFTPAGSSGPLPGVIVLTDIGGMRPAYDEKAQTIADAGYAVLLPNIYYRSVAGQAVPDGKSFRDPDIMPVVRGYASQLTPAAQAEDFKAWLAAMADDSSFARGPCAVIGYCLTGGFAVRMAALHPDHIVAAAGFHSAQLAPADGSNGLVEMVGAIKARVYFGHADKDEHLPPDQIARMDEALAAAGVHFSTELYKGAMHGFTAKGNPAYHPQADALHFKRVFTLLEETLRA